MMSEQAGLGDRQADTFTGDRIDISGGVPEQQQAVTSRLRDTNTKRTASTSFAQRRRVAHAPVQRRETGQQVGEQSRAARHRELVARLPQEGNVDFVVANGRDVRLGLRTPEHLHVVGPRSDPEMLADTVAVRKRARRSQTGALAGTRHEPVCADHQPRGEGSIAEHDSTCPLRVQRQASVAALLLDTWRSGRQLA